jgi:predicted DNA-binding transcriptional regulator AlpA
MTKPAPTLPFVPRGLSREQAAIYVGVGVSTWDQMVQDGRMPRPRQINARLVWDRLEVDMHFADLPVQAPPDKRFGFLKEAR